MGLLEASVGLVVSDVHRVQPRTVGNPPHREVIAECWTLDVPQNADVIVRDAVLLIVPHLLAIFLRLSQLPQTHLHVSYHD